MNEFWLDVRLGDLATTLGTTTLVLNPFLAVILIGITCGSVGSTVLANRMAFFSDAMAHTAFAGVALAVLQIILFAGIRSTREADAYLWIIEPVMVLVGIVVGSAMVYVRERSGLTNDTIIGVFFAASVGFGTMLLPEVRRTVNLDPEQFLYGSIAVSTGEDLVRLAIPALLVPLILCFRNNAMALASFNPTLAKSRGLPVRLDSYLLVILLAVVVNTSIRSVGVLLVNALLIVPAAAAANLGRNLREVFWWTILGTIAFGLVGLSLCYIVRIPLGGGRMLVPAPSSSIVLTAVAWFFGGLLWSARRTRRTARPTAS